MASIGRPKRATLRARWLGEKLRTLRDANGVKLDEVGEFLKRSAGTISRFESGMYPIRSSEVLALLDFYGVSDAKQRKNMLHLADAVWQPGWWDGYTGEVEDWFIDFVWVEELATEQLLFDNTVLPGLLQTREYARAVMVADDRTATAAQIDRWIELRMARQAILDRDDPPTLRSVLDEAVLRRQVGGPEVMRTQMRHLLEMSERDAITVRVLPFRAGAHASPTGPFNLFTMADPYPEVAYVETLKGALYIESPDSESIARRYDRLWEASMSPTESAEFISGLIEER
ncbi:transcriptional regulator with XRE-family HTH domain [Murinocardiopsis flavida]|uniref:Transcriptional regulator with XRE-family HTH domain n=1 Tax=Murinocardiopsis flavida TaxID=645275 RepID=A0A2P8DHU6_9ACTN|nr:helix-turn-helix transcriptional regulator [Murinocardiopsis flavida]PSK96791.1 transcriptional regulator with XRE-family HTH domain [Murinocardiopsis flavida]